MKKLFSLNKIVCVLCLFTLIGIMFSFAVLSEVTNVYENNCAEEVAFAESTVPEASLGVIYSLDEISESGNSRVDIMDGGMVFVDLTTTNWYSKDSTLKQKSLYYQYGFEVVLSSYTYDYQYYDDEGILRNGTETIDGNTESFILADNNVSGVEITVNGKTWYGENFNRGILSNPTNFVAGIYNLSSIYIKFNYTFKYITKGTASTEGGTDLVYGSKTVTLEKTYDFSSVDYKIVASTDVNVKPTASNIGQNTLKNNLGISATYNPDVYWKNKIKIYDDKNSLAEDEFAYSYSDGSNKMFSSVYGFYPDLNSSSFGLSDSIGGINIYDKLCVGWYNNKDSMSSISELSEEDTVNAGTYYLKLQVADDSLYEYESSMGIYYTLNFIYEDSSYIQEFEVDKQTLKLSIDATNDYSALSEHGGIMIANTGKPYSEEYTEIALFYEDKNTIIPTGRYYLLSGTTYVPTGANSVFDIGINYYINAAGASIMFQNVVSDTNTESAGAAWVKMGGYLTDFDNYIGINSSYSLFSFEGSHFEDYVIKTYDKVYLNVSFDSNLQKIAQNYTFAIGTWNEEGVFERIEPLKEGNDKFNISHQAYYEIAGTFKITPPNVLVKADDLLNSLGDIYYGNYACSKEIDFSSVIIDSINAVYNSETKSYSLVTSEADWEIKIVGNEDLIVKNANKHMIYVWMRLGKFTETKPESTNEYYQSVGGGYYIPLPDSIDISKNDLAGFLYRGDYSVFCIIKTFLKNNTTGIPTTSVCELGNFTVFNENNVGIVTISMVDCLALTINPVEIYLNMLDINTNKYYDGTNIVKTNNGGKASEKTEIALLQNYEFSNLLLAAGYKNIIDRDFSDTLDYVAEITYIDMMAGEDKSIGVNYWLTKKSTYQGLDQEVTNRINCYYPNSNIYKNGESLNSLSGNILYRTINVNVLKDPDRITDTTDENYVVADYAKDYGQSIYVAIKVGNYNDILSNGKSLAAYYKEMNDAAPQKNYYADYYYYYTPDNAGFCFYTELPNLYDPENPYKYVFLETTSDSYQKAIGGFDANEDYYAFENNAYTKKELTKDTFAENTYYVKSGFLTKTVEVDSTEITVTEGYRWDPTKVYEPFELFNSGLYQEEVVLEAVAMIVWKDIDTGLEISEYTDASDNNQSYYTLGVNNDFTITNYKVLSDATFTLNIAKITLDPVKVFDLRADNLTEGRIIYYDATSKIGTVFTRDPIDATKPRTSFINIERHNDYSYINAIYDDFTDFLTVIGLKIDFYEGEYSVYNRVYDELQCGEEEIRKMVIAGTYTLRITVPATRNYKAVTTEHTIEVHPITVNVYPTVAIRSYMEQYDASKEVSIASENTFLYKDSINDYMAFLNLNDYMIYKTWQPGYEEVCVYYDNDNTSNSINTDYIHLYFEGFIGEDRFDINNGDIIPNITLNLPFDSETNNVNAGKHPGVVQISGGFKKNYIFNYMNNMGSLYVKKLALDVVIDGNQKKVYTGKYIVPDYKIQMSSGEDKSSMAELTMYAAGYYIFDTSINGYRILVKDYTDKDNPFMRDAVIKNDFAETGDYYFYYIKGDYNINIYKDNAGYFYYELNDTSAGKTYLSREINLNFKWENAETGGYYPYIDKLEIGGSEEEIYIYFPFDSVREQYDNRITDVFYYEDYIGGYILNIQAEPSEVAGGSSTNYDKSILKTIMLEIAVLTISLVEKDQITVDDITVNPIWKSVYNSNEYDLNSFENYYEGGKSVNYIDSPINGEYYWGKIEFVTSGSAKDFWYYNSEENFSDLSYYSQLFAQFNSGETGDFSKANELNSITDAGLYIILLKATINDGSFYSEQKINMRRNIKFGTRNPAGKYGGRAYPAPENEYEAYFVLYLVVERSDDFRLGVYSKSDNVDFIDNDDDGEYDTFTKIFDGKQIEFGENLTVSGKESSSGEIISVRAYIIGYTNDGMGTTKEVLYFTAINGSVVYSDIAKNPYGISLTNVNNFKLLFKVNYNDIFEINDRSYNNNYVSCNYTYEVNIKKRAVNVYLTTIDGEESCKNYGEANSEVEYKFTYKYGNWPEVMDEDTINSLIALIGAPVINWENVSTIDDVDGIRISAADDYDIYAKSGPLTHTPKTEETIGNKTYSFDNYYFDYTTSKLNFVIKRKDYTLKIVDKNDGSLNFPEEDFPVIVVETTSEYTGTAIFPSLKRYGVRKDCLDNDTENEDYMTTYNGYDPGKGDYISIVLKGRILNYDSSMMDEYRLGQGGSWLKYYESAIDVGYYLFEIHVGGTTNYNEYTYKFNEEDTEVQRYFYVVYEIKKTTLRLNFVNVENGNEIYRGSSGMVYNGGKGDYLPFNTLYNYDDLVGNDKNYSSVRNIQKIQHISTAKGNYTGIQELFLTNPLYVFVNQNGVELRDTENNPYLPTEAGMYYIKLVFDKSEGYGYAANYNIVVEYEKDTNGDILYPTFEIRKRKVRAVYDSRNGNERISKVYNGTDRVTEGSVTNRNYTFTKVSDDNDSGLITGDDISLKVLYAYSRYARSTVYDEFDVLSDIDVYLLVVESELDGLDANNYELVLEDNIYTDENGTKFIKLVGTILPASTTVRFYNSAGELKTSGIQEQYDGEHQDVRVEVIGVPTDDLQKDIDFIVTYTSDNNYDSRIAPIHCDTYNVAVSVINKNYTASTSNITLEVYPANVQISFGGDAEQMYGNITIGLVATATGVGGYMKPLSVSYCRINEDGSEGEPISDISTASTGSYYAIAHHKRSGDFAEKRELQVFTITRRTTYINYDVAPSYTYIGKPVNVLMYFIDNNEKFYPKLLFDRKVNGEWIPYNYAYSDADKKTIDGTSISAYPSDVGEYRVMAYSIFENYYVTDPVWCMFEIEKSDLIVHVKDITVTYNDEYEFTLDLKGLLGSGSVGSVLGDSIKYKYYDAKTGTELYEKPVEPGEYKVICYDGKSQNYNLTYNFGLLTINKREIFSVVKTDDADSKQSVTIEGSFSPNTEIVVTKEKNAQYASLTKAFDSFKETNENFAGFVLGNIYIMEYKNYTVSNKNAMSTIRIYMPDFFNTANNASSEESVVPEEGAYYVTVLDFDGNLSVIKAEQNGEYLKFEYDFSTSQIKAISLLTKYEEPKNTYDWILYVGIALGVLLIAVAVIIVVKKN